jgi:hypothetical protein
MVRQSVRLALLKKLSPESLCAMRSPDAGTCDSVSHADDVVMASCDRASRKSRGRVIRNDFTSARVVME